MKLATAFLLSALLAGFAGAAGVPVQSDYLAYIGTFTTKDSKGIYAFRYNSSDHKLIPLGLAAAIANPSFVTFSPNGRYLYSVSAVAEGTVTAFRIDFETGKLIPINTVSSHGGGPCHLLVDHSGKSLFVANFRTGSVASMRIRDDGGLSDPVSFFGPEGHSVDPVKQIGPHAHSVNIPKSNRFVLTTDLGLDRIFSYRIDAATATMTPVATPFVKVESGAGPRHFAFSQDERYAYVVNEIQSSVSVFHYDAAAGALQEIQTVSTLPEHYSGKNTGAEIALDPSGRFIYSSNRGHDSIAQFAIDAATGRLSLAGLTSSGGKTPRHFEFAPDGDYLFAANQDSDNIAAFRVDKATGRLTPTGETYPAPTPVCIKFVAAGR